MTDFDIIKMHGSTIKVINAQQAKLCTKYKNTKLKLLKTNAAIRFNKMCRAKHLKLNYISIKINWKKPQDKKITTKAVRYRINQKSNFSTARNTLSLWSSLIVSDNVSYQNKTKLQFCISYSLYFWIANWKTKYSAPNDSKHSLTSICSLFLPEGNFDPLRLSPNM
jgi:hypothetical protein